MALQGSGQISASQIANEFGYNHPITGTQSGSEVSLGTYRKVGLVNQIIHSLLVH